MTSPEDRGDRYNGGDREYGGDREKGGDRENYATNKAAALRAAFRIPTVLASHRSIRGSRCIRG